MDFSSISERSFNPEELLLFLMVFKRRLYFVKIERPTAPLCHFWRHGPHDQNRYRCDVGFDI